MPRPNIIIGLVGPKGSGKGTVAHYLEKRYSATVISSPAILTNILAVLGQEQTRRNSIALVQALRHTFGEDALSIAVAAAIADIPKKRRGLIVIDNIRPLPDWKPWIKQKNAFLLALHADPKLRFERIRRRSRTADEKTLTFARFLKEEKMPTETATIMKTSTHAAFHVDTAKSVTFTYRQIDDIATRLKLNA